MSEFGKTILIGIVFDLTSKTNADGYKPVDYVKKYLLEKVDDMTKIFVSNKEKRTIPETQGDSTYLIATYKEPVDFKIDKMFKDTVSLVGEYLEDCEKHIYLFTDRFKMQNNFHYKKGFLSNDIKGYNIKIKVMGFGDFYDKNDLKKIVEEFNAEFLHIDKIESLK